MRFNKKNLYKFLPAIILAVTLVPYFFTYAQVGNNPPPSSTFTLQNPIKVDSVSDLISSFVEIFSYLVILFAVLALIWVGLQFILARGDVGKMKELKEWLLWIVVGVAVVIGARLIVEVVINTLSATGTIDQSVINSTSRALNKN